MKKKHGSVPLLQGNKAKGDLFEANWLIKTRWLENSVFQKKHHTSNVSTIIVTILDC